VTTTFTHHRVPEPSPTAERGWDSPVAARRAVFAWITRYNTRRRHSTCGQLSPIAYETRYTPTTLQEAA